MNSNSGAENKYDVVVIGSGPGGYVAAIRAAQLGLNVALIEKDNIGGVCLNWGCIPTKALLHAASVFDTVKNSDIFGIKTNKVTFDLSTMVDRSRDVVKRLTSGINALMRKYGVKVLNGRASIKDCNTIQIFDKNEIAVEVVYAKYIIIAVGARANVISGFDPDGEFIWTYKEAMMQRTLPKSLLIVGSGAIGMEFASFYNTLGTKVTVLEALPGILSTEDDEIVKIANSKFLDRGIAIYVGVKLQELQFTKNGLCVSAIAKDGKIHKFEANNILMAVGILPNTLDIGLNNINLKLVNNYIEIDSYCQTSLKNVFAIGDCATTIPRLAHKASMEGIIAAEKIASSLCKYNKKIRNIDNNVPSCIYCNPQIASIGMTEKIALESGYKIRIGRSKFNSNGKSIAMGNEDGLVKVIFDESSGELIGAHVIGHDATEVIHSFIVGKQSELSELDFINTIFPHPTIGEMIRESVLDAYDIGIHG